MDKWSITVRQIKAARALLDWTSNDLAQASTVPPSTVWRIESFEGPLRGRGASVGKVIEALERVGIVFLGESEGGLGVCLSKSERSKAAAIASEF